MKFVPTELYNNCRYMYVIATVDKWRLFLTRVAVCTGQYPDFLLEAWDEYDFRKKSDTDRPGRAIAKSVAISYYSLY